MRHVPISGGGGGGDLIHVDGRRSDGGEEEARLDGGLET